MVELTSAKFDAASKRHASAMADYRSGRVEPLTTSEMLELMKAPTPLAFWRRRRGVTQAALAGLAETTQPHIAELESGKRGGSLDVIGEDRTSVEGSLGGARMRRLR